NGHRQRVSPGRDGCGAGEEENRPLGRAALQQRQRAGAREVSHGVCRATRSGEDVRGPLQRRHDIRRVRVVDTALMAGSDNAHLRPEPAQVVAEEGAKLGGDIRDVRLKPGRGLDDGDANGDFQTLEEVRMDLAALLRRLAGAEEDDRAVGHRLRLLGEISELVGPRTIRLRYYMRAATGLRRTREMPCGRMDGCAAAGPRGTACWRATTTWSGASRRETMTRTSRR